MLLCCRIVMGFCCLVVVLSYCHVFMFCYLVVELSCCFVVMMSWQTWVVSQGCSERHDKFPPKPEWVDKNILDYGYTKIQAINSTHLYMEQISDDRVSQLVWVLTCKVHVYQVLSKFLYPSITFCLTSILESSSSIWIMYLVSSIYIKFSLLLLLCTIAIFCYSSHTAILYVFTFEML